MDTKASETHLTGENLAFIEQLYAQYLEDPSSVDASWETVFEEYFEGDGPERGPSFTPRSIFAPPAGAANGHAGDEAAEYVDKLNGTHIRTPGKSSGFAATVETLVRAYRLHGHTASHIDPLGEVGSSPPELIPETYGFSDGDMDTPVRCEALFNGDQVPLGEIIDRLRELYCGTIAVEYQHISDVTTRGWLRTEIERHNYTELDGPEEQRRILEGLLDADAFETFLHRKYIGAKRFSLTGGDALVPMLREMLETGAELGMREVLIGMAHRGRLNVLHNVMGKPAANMFSEFEKTQTPEKYIGSSDVKYHMGYSSDYTTRTGHELHLSLAFNPSHLEFVDPVVIGRTRAKQERMGDIEQARRSIVPLLLHGDAAFAGQGVVAETFNLSGLEGYHVGGTLHVVINNQIGFTTLPSEGRSTRYATDLSKMLDIPIFHVNGDDPEACVRAAKLAVRYRQEFGQDVIIDLVCYRHYGHNEGDEPRYTQPLMYKVIDENSHVRESYAARLVDQGVLSEDEVEQMWDERMEEYKPIHEEIQEDPRAKDVNSLEGVWREYRGGDVEVAGEDPRETSYDPERLAELGERLAHIPEGFEANRTIGRLFKKRAQMARGEEPIDWGFAEALGFATLLDEGTHIRMSGQDSVRGTFSHRHAAIFDAQTGEAYWPARHLHDEQGRLEIINSSLSEAAVLGFEYGYSLDSPSHLVMWEAQFGDFVNGAQVIIDQFINSGEDKWKRLSGLVMLLPHGYEGQGPEHSSARLERFLQLCAEDNMFVCNLTTPAQYFHALRRHIHRTVRKPLIVMTPKSLLRLREAVSEFEDLTQGGFQHVLPEARESIKPEAVERVLVCSGKVYYDLLSHAQEHEIEDTAIIRLEQLYPLDRDALQEAVEAYPNREKLVWVQEEPKNMGPWSYIFPHLSRSSASTRCPPTSGASPRPPRPPATPRATSSSRTRSSRRPSRSDPQR